MHCIGIGSGASQYLVIESAKRGRGEHLFIEDNEDVAGAIIGLLDKALTPFLD